MKKSSLAFARRLPATFLAVASLVAARPASAQEGADAATQNYTEVGQMAPDFRVQLTDGQMMTLGSQRGKIVVLNLFATWCPTCRKELPYMEWLYQRHKGPDFNLLAVGREHSVPELKQFRDAAKLSFPIGADPDRAAFGRYANRSIPRTYLIGPSGVILYQMISYSEEEIAKLDAAIRQISQSSPAKRAFVWRKKNERALAALNASPKKTPQQKARENMIFLLDENGQRPLA